MDRETFKKMWEMSAPGSETEHLFLRLPQVEFYAEERVGENCLEVMPDVSLFDACITRLLTKCYQKFRYAEKEELPPDTKSGVRFTTLTIDTPP